jgi:aspartyl-tRNA(Asn)/glutamyl-tRNA(Gln) amidotransferase subunit A
VRSGATSASRLVADAIESHERLDPYLGAYKRFDAEGARRAASHLDEELDERRRQGRDTDDLPLAGIPVSVKDLYGVAGLPTFAGSSQALPEDPWSRDAWLVERLRRAGAVIVGKTHTVEFAYGGVGFNPHWGTPRNPWDDRVARIPGGSSSGAGVSLWEGSALIALGSDTGGSIRIPAAFAGVVGHKTTEGRWPTDGVVQLSSTFDTVGALTRTVEDSIHFFSAVDPAVRRLGSGAVRMTDTAPDELRLAMPESDLWASCQDDIADVLRAAVHTLREAGATVASIDGRLVDEAAAHYLGSGIGGAECRAFLETQLPGWLERLHPTVGARVAKSPELNSQAYRAAIGTRQLQASRAHELFADGSLLLLPGNVITPPPVDEIAHDLDAYVRVNAATLRPTCPVNLLGLCAVTIPVGQDRSGMPVGLQFVGPGGADETVLAAAHAAERVLGTASSILGTPPLP